MLAFIYRYLFAHFFTHKCWFFLSHSHTDTGYIRTPSNNTTTVSPDRLIYHLSHPSIYNTHHTPMTLSLWISLAPHRHDNNSLSVRNSMIRLITLNCLCCVALTAFLFAISTAENEDKLQELFCKSSPEHCKLYSHFIADNTTADKTDGPDDDDSASIPQDINTFILYMPDTRQHEMIFELMSYGSKQDLLEITTIASRLCLGRQIGLRVTTDDDRYFRNVSNPVVAWTRAALRKEYSLWHAIDKIELLVYRQRLLTASGDSTDGKLPPALPLIHGRGNVNERQVVLLNFTSLQPDDNSTMTHTNDESDGGAQRVTKAICKVCTKVCDYMDIPIWSVCKIGCHLINP